MKPMKNLTTAVLVVVALALQACASINPVSRADTVGQKAYGLYGTFTVYEEQAAVVAQDANVPQNVRHSLVSLDTVAKPILDKLVDLALSLDGIRLDLKAGKTTEDQLVIATANLAQWYNDAVPKVHALVAAVQGAKR